MNILQHNKFISNITTAIKQNRLPQSILIHSYENGDHFRAAMEIALRLNCSNLTEDLTPCYECNTCKSILSLNSPDVLVLFPVLTNSKEEENYSKLRKLFGEFPYMSINEWINSISAGSKQLIISVEHIRNLKQKLLYKNFNLKNRVVIIWYAEKMNIQASNALLKSLEEPSLDTYFVLTTENYSNLLPTITSRCQRILLDKFSEQDIKEFLINEYNVSESKAAVIAKLSEGSISNAYKILQEMEDNSLLSDFRDLLTHIYRKDLAKLNEFAYEFAHTNREYQKYFLKYVLQKLRAAIHTKIGTEQFAVILEKERKMVNFLATTLSMEDLVKLSEYVDEGIYYISRNVNVQFWLFNFGIRMSNLFKRK